MENDIPMNNIKPKERSERVNIIKYNYFVLKYHIDNK